MNERDLTSLADELKALNDWMREPDFAENFSLAYITDWINRRPIATTARLAAHPAPVAGYEPTFQSRVGPWLMECFGLEIARDILERNHRFLEEAIELVQANGCTQSEAHQLVDYVYGRDQGEINQEVGGVMVTLAALCLASGVDMHEAAEAELARVWTKVEKIRAKHFAKPKFSALPGYAGEACPTPAREETQSEGVREYLSRPSCHCYGEKSRDYCLDKNSCRPITQAQSLTAAPAPVELKPFVWRAIETERLYEACNGTIWRTAQEATTESNRARAALNGPGLETRKGE
jgi:NTP pyrophosphatase (non-canonical NTP hydrolase)